MTIKAIETEYRGYRFRSRLEARWAVFFETAGIPYEYEPEGFDIDGRWYLPDFKLLPSRGWSEAPGGTWVEVKPELPSPEELCFLRHAGRLLRGLLLVGPIPHVPDGERDLGWRLLLESRHSPEELSLSGRGEEGDEIYGFGSYHKNDRLWWLNWLPTPERPAECYQFDGNEYMRPEILDAYRAARRARFEHGENGA